MRIIGIIAATAVSLISGTAFAQSTTSTATTQQCSIERRDRVTVAVCSGKEYVYVTERGLAAKVSVPELTPDQIEVARRKQALDEIDLERRRGLARIDVRAADDERQFRRAVAQTDLRIYEHERRESFEHAGNWYRRRSSNPTWYSSGGYAAYQQKLGGCASERHRQLYRACDR